MLFVHFSHPLTSKIRSFYRRKKDHPKLPKTKLKKRIDPKIRFFLNYHIAIWELNKQKAEEEMTNDISLFVSQGTFQEFLFKHC